MTKCPYCDTTAETVQEEIEHMQTAHPEVIAERLAKGGFAPDGTDLLAGS